LEPVAVKALANIIVGTGDELSVGALARLSLWPDQIRASNRNPNAVISGFSPDDMKEARAFVRVSSG
jgi:hypothetical protein